LPESHPASFRRYLKERIVSRVQPRAFHFIDGEAADVHDECRRVGKLITQQTVDVAFVGIGENGHLAFNDPPADFEIDEPYIVVKLDDACRQNSPYESPCRGSDKLAEGAAAECRKAGVPDTACVMPLGHDVIAAERDAYLQSPTHRAAQLQYRLGNSLPLRHIPGGTEIHAVELQIGAGAQLGRSAGAVITLMAKEGDWATLRLPSGETRRVSIDCRATVGSVGNAEASLIKEGKAGRKRWKGQRPQTRGVAMNPNDHPLGGGEGKTSGGRHPVSPWGKPEGRTRKRKASDSQIIRRRKSGKGRK
jgi:hypothetical protein